MRKYILLRDTSQRMPKFDILVRESGRQRWGLADGTVDINIPDDAALYVNFAGGLTWSTAQVMVEALNLKAAAEEAVRVELQNDAHDAVEAAAREIRGRQ